MRVVDSSKRGWIVGVASLLLLGAGSSVLGCSKTSSDGSASAKASSDGAASAKASSDGSASAKASPEPPTPMSVCKQIEATGEVSDCRNSTPDGLGNRAKVKVEFTFTNVRENGELKGGQILQHESDEDLDATISAFETMKSLAGPHRYASRKARIFLQANSNASPEIGAKLKGIVEGLDGGGKTSVSASENAAGCNATPELFVGSWTTGEGASALKFNLAADGKFDASLRGKDLSGTWKFADGAIAWMYDQPDAKSETNALLECSKSKFVVRELDGSSTTYVAASAKDLAVGEEGDAEAIPLTEYPPNRVSDGAVIAPIPADCKKPLLILGSSPSQEFNFLRAVLWAHPEYRIVPEGKAAKEGDVEFKQFEFMGGYTPVAQCADAKTCEFLGRAFQAVVRKMKARTACDDPKTPGTSLDIDIDPRGFKAKSLIASDYRAKCARLGACMIKADPKTPGDPALSCQAGPNKFKLDCAWASSCADVMACVDGKIPTPTSP